MRVQWTWKSQDDSNWRAKSDVGRWWGLAGVGTHCLDLIRWVMLPSCGEVVAVTSHITRNVWNGENDETAMVLLEFESGATAELTTSVLFHSEPSVEIYGSEGSAIGRGTLGPLGGGTLQWKGEAFPFDSVDPYAGEMKDFADAIRTGRDPEVSGEEGLRNVEILLEAAPRS
jgi:1,5-anhydro-D-fructose reductase (1,5-anhydro-D-mannitol-forming)